MKIRHLLWQLPKAVQIDLLMELRDGMSESDQASFEKRIQELFDTKEDRGQAWRQENEGSFDAQRRIHRGPKDNI